MTEVEHGPAHKTDVFRAKKVAPDLEAELNEGHTVAVKVQRVTFNLNGVNSNKNKVTARPARNQSQRDATSIKHK